MGAVIDAKAFAKHRDALAEARRRRRSSSAAAPTTAWAGSSSRRSCAPSDPDFRLLKEELFGPIATAFVYDDAEWDATLDARRPRLPVRAHGRRSHAQDEDAVAEARARLRYAAGNFYVNDKPTGAVVGQQPFGGARASGTNDKAGSLWNLIRWTSPRADQDDVRPADGLPLSLHGRRRVRRRDLAPPATIAGCTASRHAVQVFVDHLAAVALGAARDRRPLPPRQGGVRLARLAQHGRGRVPGDDRCAGGRCTAAT